MGCCGVSTNEREKNTPPRFVKPNVVSQQNNQNNQKKENYQQVNVLKKPLEENTKSRNNKREETPITVEKKINNNNNSTEQMTVQNNLKKRESKINEEQKKVQNSLKQRESKINEIQKPKEIKKEKFKPLKNINILDNVKEYFPGDVTRDEIEEMVLSAIGDSIVKGLNFKKGVNLTMEHAQAIIDILYMTINETNNGDKNYEKILEDVKLKIGFCDINKDSIKNIMFKGQNPTDEEIEQVLEQFEGCINPKLFVIELVN